MKHMEFMEILVLTNTPDYRTICSKSYTYYLLFLKLWFLLQNWLTDLEVFATIVAALIHDFEHTGTTNNFHIQTS